MGRTPYFLKKNNFFQKKYKVFLEKYDKVFERDFRKKEIDVLKVSSRKKKTVEK